MIISGGLRVCNGKAIETPVAIRSYGDVEAGIVKVAYISYPYSP